MTPATAPAPETVDALSRLLVRVGAWYDTAPVVFWSVIGLVALALVMWGWRGRPAKG